MANQLAHRLRQRIYAFRAQRLNIGTYPTGNTKVLEPDGRNLAQVLNFLQADNPDRWATYVHAVQSVLPQVKGITVPPSGDRTCEIRLWSIPLGTQRPDLAVTLEEAGTGIGQVLAMLYVILNEDMPQTILIDEPQSFLHPGAVRKLIDIFRLHPKHQYLIATHSASAVSAARSESLLLVTAHENESTITVLDAKDTSQLRMFLTDVGVRLGDVFGSDSVLWVEGQTEEECFPLIIAERPGFPGNAMSILAVRNTGDLQHKEARLVFDIYSRITKGPRLLPPAVGFLFDREYRTLAEIDELSRRSGGRIKFTKRAMFENYLLDESAIAAVVSTIEGFTEENVTAPVDAASIAQWFNEHQWRQEFFSKTLAEDQRSRSLWLQEVHGAAFLDALFSEMSQTRVPYRKVDHGYALTAWLVRHRPESFDEIADIIHEFLVAAQ